MRKLISYNFLVFLCIVVIDQLTKYWARGLDSIKSIGPLTFKLVFNESFALGSGKNFSDLATKTFSISFGFFLLLIFLILIYLLKDKKVFNLIISITLVFAGIMGNVIDKVMFNKVTDFIFLSLNNNKAIILNFADVSLVVGIVMTIFYMIYYSNRLWFNNDLRGRKLIDLHFQGKYILLINLFISCVSLNITVFAISFFSNFFNINRDQTMTFILYSCIITFLYLISSTLFFIIITHQTRGPLEALKNFAMNLREDSQRPIRLRKNDDFKFLEELSKVILKHINNKE